METISALFTVQWWISVVIVGLLINVLSAYIKIGFDRLFSTLSKKYRERSAAARASREYQLEQIAKNPDIRLDMLMNEMRYRLRAILMAVVLASCLALVALLKLLQSGHWIYFYAISIPVLMILMTDLTVAMKNQKMVEAARERFRSGA